MRAFINWRKVLLSLVLTIITLPVFSATREQFLDTAVMMQVFHWNSADDKSSGNWWKKLSGQVAQMKAASFNMVWIPPSSDSRFDAHQGYIPKELFNLNSEYGSADELKSLLKSFTNASIIPLADIVINHRGGTTPTSSDFKNPDWPLTSVCRNDEQPGQGNYDTGFNFKGDGDGARDIDHTQGYVRDDIATWLNWLKTSGYKGWRFDFVRGYSSAYIKEYIEKSKPVFAVAEIWDNLDPNNSNPHRQALCDWLDSIKSAEISVFDFTTKGLLNNAVATEGNVNSGNYWRLRDNEGKPAGLIGWWPERSVTFVDNHDTGSSPPGNSGQHHWPLAYGEVMQGYAYIMTHPGIPCVYHPHFFDWGTSIQQQITDLISLRKQYKINRKSAVNILFADNEKYVAEIDEHVLLRLGYSGWTPDLSQWVEKLAGRGYKIWIKK